MQLLQLFVSATCVNNNNLTSLLMDTLYLLVSFVELLISGSTIVLISEGEEGRI